MIVNIVGFKQATITNDMQYQLVSSGVRCEILEPDDFFAQKYSEQSEFLVAVTKDLALRQQIINEIKVGNLIKFTSVHPTSIVHPSAQIGAGTFIGPFGIAPFLTELGEDCIVAPYCQLGHNAKIGPNTIIQSGTIIGGSSTIGSNCVLHLRTTVIDKINICDNVTLGAGALVTKDITEPGFYLGSPARKKIDVS
jgi:UDP-3-O-[3-hydroxymyristoyl] glucosamine N-acyltransferase